MAEKFKFKLNREGVRELLKSEDVRACLESEAGKRAGKLGAGYETETYSGRNRLNVRIKAVTREAIQENLDNNTLLKVIGS